MDFVVNFAVSEIFKLSIRGQSVMFMTWDISEVEGFSLLDTTM